MKKTLTKIGILALTACAVVAPSMALAQSGHQINKEIARRNQTRDEWKSIATLSGAVAVLGLLSKDDTLTFAGGAGALYSLYRYNEDTKSKDRLSRLRAEYFSRDHFYRDGVRYDRHLVVKSGKKYYQFVKEKGWQKPGHHDNGKAYGRGKSKGHH
ncbi:MAG: hypothetical protein JST12_02210 [Armatimonadetes bacterium]|nr:hypothetical protein [Armatimonadota bacterium]MBS1725288.1 hypothetical protein [Armatimonadota bacterium]